MMKIIMLNFKSETIIIIIIIIIIYEISFFSFGLIIFWQVLSKFPVIQHFVFGTLLSLEEAEVFKKPL